MRMTDQIAEAARFLLDRLDEFSGDQTDDEAFVRWHGHVEPAMARLKAVLSPATRDEYDFGLDAAETAAGILHYLGRGTSPSYEPGSDPRRDRIARLIEACASRRLAQPADRVTARYTNWRGEARERTFIPQRVYFGSNEWHPEPQVLIDATDCETGNARTFAAAGFAAPGAAHMTDSDIREEAAETVKDLRHWADDADLPACERALRNAARLIEAVVSNYVPAAEPVAWAVMHEGAPFVMIPHSDDAMPHVRWWREEKKREVTPLYAAPDGWRPDAEKMREACARWCEANGFADAAPMLRKLPISRSRAALKEACNAVE